MPHGPHIAELVSAQVERRLAADPEADPQHHCSASAATAAFIRAPPAKYSMRWSGSSDPRFPTEFYDDLEREIFPLLWNDQRAWVAHHFAPVRDGRLDLAYQPVLIHGDLAQYHILYDPATLTLAGILDFGTAGMGDPAVDFAIIISMYGERFLRRVARTYPAISVALDRARFLAGTHELQWALGGVRTLDRSRFVAHIGRARDASPIGTSWVTSTSGPRAPWGAKSEQLSQISWCRS